MAQISNAMRILESAEMPDLLILTQVAAQEMFPDETWEMRSPDVYVAGSRGKTSKNERTKTDKEAEQAAALAKEGHIIFLTPETGTGKQFDGLIDGKHTLELKQVTGSVKKVGSNFRDAVGKAEIVFLHIIECHKKQDIYAKLRGELKAMERSGEQIKGVTVYIKIQETDIYELSVENLLK